MHDMQTGRFIQVDPLAEKYTHNSTYAFSENKVVRHIELEGAESLDFMTHWGLSGGNLDNAVMNYVADWVTSPFVKVVNGGGYIK